MTNGNDERRIFDPLDRTTFDAIAYNAVGRASSGKTSVSRFPGSNGCVTCVRPIPHR